MARLGFGWVGLALVLGLGAAACGDDSSGPGDEPGGEGGGGSDPSGAGGEDPGEERGFVACGDTTCQPGQFCEEATLSFCDLGCQSNNNCAADQSCEEISDVTHIGTCLQAEQPEDQLTRCKDACSKMVSCELLTAAEGSGCQSECAAASEDMQRSVADCVEPWACEAPIPACLGIDCGGAYACPSADEACVDGTCL